MYQYTETFPQWFAQFAGMLHLICDGYDLVYADLPIEMRLFYKAVNSQIDVSDISLQEMQAATFLIKCAENGPDIVGVKIGLSGGVSGYAIAECKGSILTDSFSLSKVFTDHGWQGGRIWARSGDIQKRYLNRYTQFYSVALGAMVDINAGAPYDLYYILGHTSGLRNILASGTSRGKALRVMNIPYKAQNKGNVEIAQYYLVG